jgi:hypothetical protein
MAQRQVLQAGRLLIQGANPQRSICNTQDTLRTKLRHDENALGQACLVVVVEHRTH